MLDGCRCEGVSGPKGEEKAFMKIKIESQMNPEFKTRPVFVAKNPTDEPEKWLRVGTAFLNKDGSLNVELDVLPVSGIVRIGGAQ